MCPICWINGLIAFMIGMGVLAIDSPYTPYLIGLAMILTGYSVWKFYRGYKMWLMMNADARARNWKTIKRFTQGVILGAVIASGVFYAVHWPALKFYHHHTTDVMHVPK